MRNNAYIREWRYLNLNIVVLQIYGIIILHKGNNPIGQIISENTSPGYHSANQE
jgi:hypothetical protein